MASVITRLAAGVALLLGASVTTVARSGEVDSVARILMEQRRIHDEIVARDESYGHLDEFKRSRIVAAQLRVFQSFAGHQEFDELAPDTQLQVFNDLKKIAALLGTGDVGDAIVCQRVALAGTRRYQMACMTGEERDRRAESARRALMERAACTTQACIGS